ncbi:Tetratricopeptide-like helical [Macrophomina phaseolina MS6]|uniref:Histone transcription regulator 3 homolog n=1 Tax=Macrophomina phaseolina (strain MS6) TaxID=1126212 RepID=K2SC94_MACPH|nr:Tetratricopeptide-like helical [Macrophomina phaseolina MS6]
MLQLSRRITALSAAASQSLFKAINIESDVESDEEVDDTKEIQIEEALKLYQTALKYHSEGPKSYPAAIQAYKALFESDIFKYPESLSEYRRSELNGDPDYDFIFQDDYEAGPTQLPGTADSAPNTLPQILHLSYKNHGQFMLEVVQHSLRERQDTLLALDAAASATAVDVPLRYFAEALDKDDSDLDLWTRTASVAALTGSSRITRFCLEAVLDGDDEGLDSILRIPGLEEGFAGQQLRELVEKLQDNLSLLQAPLSDLRKRKLSAALKKRLAPFSYAPLPADVKKRETLAEAFSRPTPRLVLTPVKPDWAHVGDVILNQYLQEQQRLVDLGPGLLITLNLPGLPTEIVDPQRGPVDATSVETTAAHAQGDSEIQRTREGKDAKAATQNGEDTEMKETSDSKAVNESTKNGEGNSAEPSDRPTAPSRKRSTESAGLPDTAEGGRGRSKRIRARESIGDGNLSGIVSAADAAQQQVEDELKQFHEADDWLYEIVGDMLAKLDVKGLRSPKVLRDMLRNKRSDSSEMEESGFKTPAQDLYTILQQLIPQAVHIITGPDTIDVLANASREAGLNAFLGYTKSPNAQNSDRAVLDCENLSRWQPVSDTEGLPIKELVWSWLQSMLRPGAFPDSDDSRSSYMRHQWSDDLKRVVVQAMVNADDFLHERLTKGLSSLDARILRDHSADKKIFLSNEENSLIEMIQTIFELHLDVYSLIKHPTSSVDVSTQLLQRERLERWCCLSRDAMAYRSYVDRKTIIDEIDFRHLWASTFHLSVSEEVPQDFVVSCIEELKTIADLLPSPAIHVPNNAIMPELSVEAAERELTKINMKDCFMKVFQHDEHDPVSVIESLEPILEASNQEDPRPINRIEIADSQDSEVALTPDGTANGSSSEKNQDIRPSPLQAMTRFVSSANVSLRLSLWQRLRQAYEAIDYPPKVMSCYLRSIEILVKDIKSKSYSEAGFEQRSSELLKTIKIIDDIFERILKLASLENVFECIDDAHMRSSMNTISELLWLLNTVTVFEDLIRVGQIPQPTFEGRFNSAFTAFMGKLHDTMVRGWLLQFRLLCDAMAQDNELFPKPTEDKFEYLRHVHYAFGIRGFCSASNKALLRLMKDEVLKWFKSDEIPDIETRDTVICQVLYDLYGLFFFTNADDLTEYPSDHDPMDQKTAMKILDFVMYQARKVNLKDLHKTQLGSTIDVVHGYLARAKPAGAEDLLLNKMKYNSFIKSPVNPLDLYRCVNGVGGLSTKPIPMKNARIASRGWFFLMGSIALNRFRSQNQKRQAPVPTEDINIASAFFGQDLEYDAERWETWYSQAQAYDYQIDEMVAWSAEKVNKGDPELVQHQRAAIHCYTMAVATAIRNADASEDTANKIAQLYADFGMRIYSSSRDPLSMQAFTLKDTEERFYSTNQVMRSVPFAPMTPVMAWKFASGLFKRAIARKPDNWLSHYMLGKCLWKMHTTPEGTIQPKNRPSVEEVVTAFTRAIEELPGKKGSRGDPILEPHYKILAILYKLVQRRELEPRDASEKLQATHYARQVPVFSPEDSEHQDDWDDYILKVLKALRSADKSNWHHRMTARAARIHYGEPSPADVYVAALSAKGEFSQQIFTKTMQLQVWKPEYERLGRHFVYTTRYTLFFIQLLFETGDRAGMEALAKRVRRRNHEFFEHTKLWQHLCLTYLKMLRRAGQVPEGHEDAVFKSINHEEWTSAATRLEAWCHDPETKSNVLEVLREAMELRRLNNNLMKATLIDDLIGDTYALLYQQIVPTLQPDPEPPAPPAAQPPAPPLTAPAAPPPQPAPTYDRTNMMSMQNIMNLDGAGANEPTPPAGAFGVLSIGNKPAGAPNSTAPTTGTTTPAGGPTAPEQPATAAAPPKPRAKGVGRRELMRRADAAVTRPVAATPSTPAATSMPIRASPARPSVVEGVAGVGGASAGAAPEDKVKVVADVPTGEEASGIEGVDGGEKDDTMEIDGMDGVDAGMEADVEGEGEGEGDEGAEGDGDDVEVEAEAEGEIDGEGEMEGENDEEPEGEQEQEQEQDHDVPGQEDPEADAGDETMVTADEGMTADEAPADDEGGDDDNDNETLITAKEEEEEDVGIAPNATAQDEKPEEPGLAEQQPEQPSSPEDRKSTAPLPATTAVIAAIAPATATAASTAPASIQDSADDESELSEIDESDEDLAEDNQESLWEHSRIALIEMVANAFGWEAF